MIPDQRRISKIDTSDDFLRAVELFLTCADSLQNSELYVNDAIEYAAYYVAAKADKLYVKALKENTIGDKFAAQYTLRQVVDLLLDVDKLLASHPLYRLEEWVELARNNGTTSEEKDKYESNAKRLITTWGGFQEDYAARFWSGLIKDYYIPRLKLYFSKQWEDLDRWEETWINTPWHNTTKPFENPVNIAVELVNKAKVF